MLSQHALRPFIDSETNHKRHFINIPFINKGIEFIDLPSNFKDRSLEELSGTKAYEETSEEEKSVVNGHCNHLALKFSLCVKERQEVGIP